MDFCQDCKHHERKYGSTHNMCLHSEARRDRVSGWSFCDFERLYGYPCGLDGNHFEQKISWFKRIFGSPK